MMPELSEMTPLQKLNAVCVTVAYATQEWDQYDYVVHSAVAVKMAIEIESLRQHLAECQKENDTHWKNNAELVNQLAECERDAERYRFIRKCLPFSTLKNITKEYLRNVPNDDVNAQLDAAIDEALAKVGAGKTGEGS